MRRKGYPHPSGFRYAFPECPLSLSYSPPSEVCCVSFFFVSCEGVSPSYEGIQAVLASLLLNFQGPAAAGVVWGMPCTFDPSACCVQLKKQPWVRIVPQLPTWPGPVVGAWASMNTSCSLLWRRGRGRIQPTLSPTKGSPENFSHPSFCGIWL